MDAIPKLRMARGFCPKWWAEKANFTGFRDAVRLELARQHGLAHFCAKLFSMVAGFIRFQVSAGVSAETNLLVGCLAKPSFSTMRYVCILAVKYFNEISLGYFAERKLNNQLIFSLLQQS
jgi:hypothetical protein